MTLCVHVDIDILYTLAVTCNLNLHILHYSVVGCQLLFFCTLWLISLSVDFMFLKSLSQNLHRIQWREYEYPVVSGVLAWSTALKFNGHSYRIIREEEKKWTVALFSKNTWLTFITLLRRIKPSHYPFLISTAIVCLFNGNKCKVGECLVWIYTCVFPCNGRGIFKSEKHIAPVYF